MRALRWIGGVLAVLAVEFFIGMGILVISLEENCDNGIERWACNDTLQDFLVAAFFFFPLAVLLVVLVSIKRRRQAHQRQRAGPLS